MQYSFEMITGVLNYSKYLHCILERETLRQKIICMRTKVQREDDVSSEHYSLEFWSSLIFEWDKYSIMIYFLIIINSPIYNNKFPLIIPNPYL